MSATLEMRLARTLMLDRLEEEHARVEAAQRAVSVQAEAEKKRERK
jgi:hypothetical protein